MGGIRLSHSWCPVDLLTTLPKTHDPSDLHLSSLDCSGYLPTRIAQEWGYAHFGLAVATREKSTGRWRILLIAHYGRFTNSTSVLPSVPVIPAKGGIRFIRTDLDLCLGASDITFDFLTVGGNCKRAPSRE